MADEIRVEFLDDGKVKVDTDQISPSNHTNAEKLMKFLDEELGAPTSRVRRAQTHTHAHAHHESGLKH